VLGARWIGGLREPERDVMKYPSYIYFLFSGTTIADIRLSAEIFCFRHTPDLNSRWYTWISMSVVAWEAKNSGQTESGLWVIVKIQATKTKLLVDATVEKFGTSPTNLL